MSEQFRIALEEYPMEWIVKLCGAQDKHLELLRNAFSCDIIMRDNELRILSEDAVTFHSIESVVKALFDMMEAHIDVSGRDIEYACRLAKLNRLQELSTTYQKAIGKTVNGKLIYPKTIGQRHLFKCMCNSEIVFATGVAGTGKTYLAVVYAADLLKKGEIRKIILTRPAVEAGENLGFLPGDLKEKVDPYLRPLYDALYDTLGQEQVEKLLEKLEQITCGNEFRIKCFLSEICITMYRKYYLGRLPGNERKKNINDILGEINKLEDMGQTRKYLLELARRLQRTSREEKEYENPIAGEAVVYIRERYSDTELSLTSAAEALNVNSSYLSRLLKKETGMNFIDILTSVRLEKAKQLLEDGSKATVVGGMVGYKDYSYFYQVFKKVEGVSPTEYKKKAR